MPLCPALHTNQKALFLSPAVDSCDDWPSVCFEVIEFVRLVYTEMIDMGYPSPYIQCAPQALRLNPPEEICLQDNFLVSINFDNPAECVKDDEPLGIYFRSLATYQAKGGRFLVCPTDHTQLFNVDKRAIRFHYFQAVHNTAGPSICQSGPTGPRGTYGTRNQRLGGRQHRHRGHDFHPDRDGGHQRL